MDVGFKSPIPAFPQFLFAPLLESHQGRAQVPVKSSQVNTPRGDVCQRSREAWKWMVAVLQFWGDEASSADGIVYGECERPVSALAEYVLNTINPGLRPGSKITWDDIVIRTPWMAKRLHGMMASQEMMVRHQALPVQGKSSELEVILEKRYFEQLLHSKGRGEARCRESHSPRSQARHLIHPRVDQSRVSGCPQATPEEGRPEVKGGVLRRGIQAGVWDTHPRPRRKPANRRKVTDCPTWPFSTY